MSSRLNPEDQHRVEQYLNTPQHRSERRAFRPWLLMLALLSVVAGLGLLSRLLAALVT